MNLTKAINRFMGRKAPLTPEPDADVVHDPSNQPQSNGRKQVRLNTNPLYHQLDVNLPDSSGGKSYVHLDMDHLKPAEAGRLISKLAHEHNCAYRMWTGGEEIAPAYLNERFASIRGADAEDVLALIKAVGPKYVVAASTDVEQVIPNPETFD